MNRNCFAISLVTLFVWMASSCHHQQAGRANGKAPSKVNYFEMTQSECLASGNRWERAGLLNNHMCIHTYADAGKTCASSADCEGDCFTETGATVTGKCSYDSNPFGCRLKIEDARAGSLPVCVD